MSRLARYYGGSSTGLAFMPHSELLATALEAARAADDVVRHYYQRNLRITINADKSPVTEAEWFLEETGCRWLPKPFRLKDLLKVAGEMLG